MRITLLLFIFFSWVVVPHAAAEDPLQITLAGEVSRPSRLNVDSNASFSEVLERSAGSTLWGDPRRFVLIRVSDKIVKGLPKLRTTAEEIYLNREERRSLKELGILSGDIIYLCRKRPMSKSRMLR